MGRVSESESPANKTAGTLRFRLWLRSSCRGGLGGGKSGDLLFEGGLGLIGDGCKGSFVAHGEIGEDLAVDRDAGGVQTFNEAAVGDAEGTCGGIDALHPQIAEVALTDLTVTIVPSQ